MAASANFQLNYNPLVDWYLIKYCLPIAIVIFVFSFFLLILGFMISRTKRMTSLLEPFLVFLILVLLGSIAMLGFSVYLEFIMEYVYYGRWKDAYISTNSTVIVKSNWYQKTELVAIENKYECCGFYNTTDYQYPDYDELTSCTALYKYTNSCSSYVMGIAKTSIQLQIIASSLLFIGTIFGIILHAIGVKYRI